MSLNKVKCEIAWTITLIPLIYLNFYPFEVVSRYRGPQLQVGKNNSIRLIRDPTFTQPDIQTFRSQYRDLID